MARDAEDLALALRVLAGPDVLQQTAWRLELPSPRCRKLGEFRVAVWATSALSEIDASVRERFEVAVAPVPRAGAPGDENAPLGVGEAQHHPPVLTPFGAAPPPRHRDPEFSPQPGNAATTERA